MSDAAGDLVFLVAHPDDVAWSMGGTALLLAAAGYRLHVICASRGERGYRWEGAGERPPSPEVARVREAEERAACERLGATLTFLDAIDGEIYATPELCARVAERLRDIRPRALFSVGPNEKPDHSAMHAAAIRGLHLAGLFWTTERYHPVRFGESYHGRPDLFVNVSSVMEAKRALCFLHASQVSEEAWARIAERTRIWGRLAWCDHAEAFTTGVAPLAAGRWSRASRPLLFDLPVCSAP